MNEEWRDIKGFEGLYQVSNLGRVKNLNYRKSKKERVFAFNKNTDGYLQVILTKEGIKKGFRVHRLVAEAFIPNPNNYLEVNHIDENKENNNVLNLEWVNHIQNSNHGTRNERISKNHSKEVIQLDLEGNEITSFQSVKEIKKQLGYCTSSIIRCCLNKPHCNTAYKYIWKYA